MAKYQRIVTTEAGLKLLAAAVAGGTVTFTAIKTGSGTYLGTEDLSTVTDLKSVRQTFGVSSITRTDTQVKLRSVLNNDNLAEGYSMTEIGLYAKEPDTGEEFLYAIIVAEMADYLPPYEQAPASITLELYLSLTEAETAVTFAAEVLAGTYVPVENFNEHLADTMLHITAAERTAWNAKVDRVGTVITDWNTVTKTGFYRSDKGNSSNSPDDSTYWIGYAIYHSPIYIVEFITDMIKADATWYTRKKWGNEVWTSWSKVNSGGNADTVDGRHASDFTSFMKVSFVYDDKVPVEDKIKEYVDSLPADSQIYNILFVYGSEYLLFVQKYGTADYASAFCIGYRAEAPYYLKKSVGVWTKANFNDGGNANTVDGYHITVVTELPAAPDANTIYFVKG